MLLTFNLYSKEWKCNEMYLSAGKIDFFAEIFHGKKDAYLK